MMMIRKWKKALVLLLVFSLILTYGLPWLLSGQAGTAKARIVLTFEGIGQGLDPNGNRFDINEVKEKEVLADALKEAGLEDQITVKELRSRITITPVVSDRALSQLTAITSVTGKTEDVTEKMIHPNEYLIGIKDTGAPSCFSSQTLLKQVMKSYQHHIKTAYIQNLSTEPVYSKEEIASLDYPEMVRVVEQEAAAMVRYAGIFAQNHPDFVSEKDGLSFQDLYQQAQTISSADVGNLKSIADYYGLTKNESNRMNYQETMLKRAQLVLSKANGREFTVSDIIALYDNHSNYVFVSGELPQLDMDEQKNEFYDNLMGQLVASKNSSIDAKYEVDEIQRAIGKLQHPVLGPEEYTSRTQELSDGVNTVYERIDKVNEQIQALAAENYDLEIGSKISVKILRYDFNSWGNFVLNFLILAAILAVCSLIGEQIGRRTGEKKLSRYFTDWKKFIRRLEAKQENDR